MGHRLKLQFQWRAVLPRPPEKPRVDPGIAQGWVKR
jgi:hypothetical protein